LTVPSTKPPQRPKELLDISLEDELELPLSDELELSLADDELPPALLMPLLLGLTLVVSSPLSLEQALSVNVMANAMIAVNMGRLTLPLRVMCLFILNLRFGCCCCLNPDTPD
jgi:hypothetical protein